MTPKLFLLFITLLINVPALQKPTFEIKNIHVIEVPGKEVGFLIDFNTETSEFRKYYVFQYERKRAILDKGIIDDITFLSADKSKLKMRVGKEDVFVFCTDENYRAAKGEVVIYGYGLAEYNAGKKPFKLLPMKDINEVNDIIVK